MELGFMIIKTVFLGIVCIIGAIWAVFLLLFLAYIGQCIWIEWRMDCADRKERMNSEKAGREHKGNAEEGTADE